jgi:primase-polymerase (primpol)-like protein
VSENNVEGPRQLCLDDLRAIPHWVAWRSEPGARPGKYEKMPYAPHAGGRKAQVDDPDSWGTFAEALEHAERLLALDSMPKGVGLILAWISQTREVHRG